MDSDWLEVSNETSQNINIEIEKAMQDIVDQVTNLKLTLENIELRVNNLDFKVNNLNLIYQNISQIMSSRKENHFQLNSNVQANYMLNRFK